MPGRDRHIYFIQEHLNREVFHGGISNVDLERIFISHNFRAIQMPCQDNFSIGSKAQRLLYLLKIFFSLPVGSCVFFQFPLYARLDIVFIRLLSNRKKITPVCFISDIDGLRDHDHRRLKKDILFLKRFTYFIVHNHAMNTWLKEIVPSAILSNLQIFDFLMNSLPTLQRKKSFDIEFAGDLPKSPFYKKLGSLPASSSGLKFHVYGTDVDAIGADSLPLIFEKRVPPAQIPGKMQGSFGLVWDGNNTETCAGGYGEYLRFNSPHKLSLYIVSGLPVIIWREAATAAFVLEHNIGFAVDRLSDIKQRIEELSNEEYGAMAENMKSLAKKVSSGYFTGKALSEILDAIANKTTRREST